MTVMPRDSLDLAARSASLPLETRNLSFEGGGKRLIDGLDLLIDSPGITVILGPNGAGKSLLLRLVHGLIAPSSGEILWGGRALDGELRKEQAMLFQRPVLLRRSALANITHALQLRGMPFWKRRSLAAKALHEAGLERIAATPARLLSGGEQQRLALARALATEPKVLLLDEPTSSIDPASTQSIEAQLVEARARGLKIIFVTHDIAQAKRLAQDVVFLHHGRLIEQAPAETFFARPQSAPARDYLQGALLI